MAFLNKEGLLHFIEKCIKPLKGAAKHEVTQSLTTNTAGYVLDARAGKTLDGKIAALNADLGAAIGKCKLVDTGYIKDSAYIEVPEGTVALAVISDAVYLIRSLSSGIKHTLIAGTLAETYKIRAASSTGRFYAEAVTAGSTCRISAVLFRP